MLHGRFAQNRVPSAVVVITAGMRGGQRTVATRRSWRWSGSVIGRISSGMGSRRGGEVVARVRFALGLFVFVDGVDLAERRLADTVGRLGCRCDWGETGSVGRRETFG